MAKASRVANMVLQALKTTGNVNVKIALSIFDKQIAPILLYGSSIWSPPRSHNLLYIHDQTEIGNTRTIVKNFLNNLCQCDVPLIYTRRVGKNNALNPRKILVKVENFGDKEKILQKKSPFITCFETETKNIFEEICKRVLNITKFASVTAVTGELGRYPIAFNAWSNSIKYWLRLSHGTKNVILNNAYRTAMYENHDWVQSIQYLLCKNWL